MANLKWLDDLAAVYADALDTGNKQIAVQILEVFAELGVVTKVADKNGKMWYNIDAGEEEGQWITTETGNHVHVNGEGEPDKGNPKIISALKSGDSFGSKYSKAFKSNTGKVYPKLKSGAQWDSDTLKEVNRLAEEGKKDDAYDAVLASLTSDDIIYQKDPEGQVVGAIPGLSQMFDTQLPGKSAEVQAAYEKRIENGQQIVKDMIAVSDGLGSRMMGLENCFKAGESTARKIDKVKATKNIDNDMDALARMDDVVRFTFKCDHDNMKNQILDLEDSLKAKGYEITERDNKFLPNPKNPGQPRDYKAVHLQVKAPSGEKFEVQVHSEETVKVKNKNHVFFEEDRKLDLKDPANAKRHQELQDIQIANWRGLADPKDIQSLPTFKNS